MIPKLCTDITETNGLGRLANVLSVSVKQELNGAYELTMRYPVGGALYSELATDLLIGTRAGTGSGVQFFRIVRISRPLRGAVTVYAQHYSYQLNYIHVPPCTITASSVQDALTQLKALAIEACPFTLSSDIATPITITIDKVTSLRSVIGGMDGSILEQTGGEVLWDNNTVAISQRLVPTVAGRRNVALRYGKNLRELEAEESIEELATGILPYWLKDGVFVRGSVQYSAAGGALSFERILSVDMTQDFEDQPSVSDLDTAGAAYITEHGIGVVAPSITATPAQLWKTAEYAHLADLEVLQLGSMVDVIYNTLGVNVTAEIISVAWDGLRERYSSMQLGQARANIASDVAGLARGGVTQVIAGGGGGDLSNYYTKPQTDALLAGKQDTPTLLWTNSSPGSSFGAQTINVDLSPYRSVMIVARLTNSTAIRSSGSIVAVGEQLRLFYSSMSGSNMVYILRDCTVTASSIVFTGGSRYTQGSAAAVAYNGGLIPIEVWGIP